MNVTISISKAIRHAVDGRPDVQLGLPRGADVGEVMQTLLNLYPQLSHLMANEAEREQTGLALVLTKGDNAPLQDGQKLLLTAHAHAPVSLNEGVRAAS